MGFLDRFKKKPALSPAEAAQALAEVRERARELIRPGFRDLDEVEEDLPDYFEDEETGLAAADFTRIAREEWAARLDEQAAWPGPGDDARLAAAFAALEADGIVARMDFTCCQTCGHAEITDEFGPDTRGYTFFHQQDTDRILEEGDVYLAFGPARPTTDVDPDLAARAVDGDEEARRQVYERSELLIAERVARAVREAGLDVEWDGTTSQRILVRLPDWRRPLPTS